LKSPTLSLMPDVLPMPVQPLATAVPPLSDKVLTIIIRQPADELDIDAPPSSRIADFGA
jgi:hypothetical protein